MKFFWSFCIFLLGFPWNVFCFSFVFHNTGPSRTYRIFSASLQNLDQNSGISHASFEQAYEAFLRTKDIDPVHNSMSLSGEYHYSQRVFRSGEAFQAVDQDKIYHSYFSRDAQGVLKSFSNKDFYPSIRSIPIFPRKDIPIGGKWNSVGSESQDFSILGYPNPFYVPFIAQYQYVGDAFLSKTQLKSLLERYAQYNFQMEDEISKVLYLSSQGKKIDPLAVIHVYYNVHYSSASNSVQTENMEKFNGNPVTSAEGFYDGLIFWDKNAQEEVLDVGEYNFNYSWKNQEKRHWSGKEYGIVNILEKDSTQVEKLVEKVKKGGKGLEVEKQKEGLKVILGDLLFHFNKISLRPQVVSTLSGLIHVLSDNPNFAIHITGYSDDIGTKEAKEEIANGRARTVADFLLNHGISASRISYTGDGDRNPRVPNTTGSNRQKNRRVEINIITQ